MTNEKFENYLSLLKIRRKANQRNLNITWGITFISILAFIGFGLLGQLSGKEIYIIAVLLVVFILNTITTWVRLHVTNALIEALYQIK
jgi:hypothetical protein